MKVILTLGAILAAAVLVALGLRTAFADENDSTSAEESEYSSINAALLKLPLASPQIVVLKGKRRLFLYSNQKMVRAYHIGLGFSPKGDKAKKGDGRTPEGKFYICQKNVNSNYYLSLGLSYPSQEDAKRGLRNHLITQEQYDRIMDALSEGDCPDWNTALGGEVFIHGNGSKRDWTWGCVALENSDIRELFDAVPEGTPVAIRP